MAKLKRSDIFDTKGHIRDEQVEKYAAENPLVEDATEEELHDFSVKKNRIPHSSFPNRLPTFGKMPLPVDEHKHIGLYESKQTLYLTIALAYNVAMDRIEKLEKLVSDLQDKINKK